MKSLDTINKLIERSSLGARDARLARATVPRGRARRVVAAAVALQRESTDKREG